VETTIYVRNRIIAKSIVKNTYINPANGNEDYQEGNAVFTTAPIAIAVKEVSIAKYEKTTYGNIAMSFYKAIPPSGFVNTLVVTTDGETKESMSFTIDESINYIRFSPDANNGDYNFKFKLVSGTEIGGRTLAPEDILAS
jgi:hypothetical protein